MISILGDRILAQRKSSSVPLTKIPSPQFDLAMTLGSGQVFHWEKMDGGFVGTIGDRPICIEQRGDSLFFCGGGGALVHDYFSLDHPLTEICASFRNDPVM